MQVIDDALVQSEKGGAPWFQAELVRLQGEILLQQSISNCRRAEKRFLEAIELARHQGAWSFELRAVIRLVRLWAQQGKRAAGRDALESVSRRCADGLDTGDLRSARTLLCFLSEAQG